MNDPYIISTAVESGLEKYEYDYDGTSFPWLTVSGNIFSLAPIYHKNLTKERAISYFIDRIRVRGNWMMKLGGLTRDENWIWI